MKTRVELHYKPEPTARRFHGSAKRVRCLMGPVGMGKSSICCWEILLRAKAQAAFNGVRRSRWAVIRQTYPELRSTTIKTFLDWFPDPLTTITYGAPITAKLAFPLEDGTEVDCEILFLALERPDDVKKLLSLELTGAWVNEWREVPHDVLKMLTARIGRYPSAAAGGATWTGIIGDTNPPDDDHWLFHLFETEKPEGYEIFKQPPALIRLPDGTYTANVGQIPGIPAAENVGHLAEGFNYWLNQVPGKDPQWIKVYVLGQYGSTMAGKPVWGEYNDALHFSENPLEPLRGVNLLVGLDFGLTPAAVIGQLAPSGRLMLLDELSSSSMGIKQFATDLLKPRLQNQFAGMAVRIKGDPAGTGRAQTDEKTCYEILSECGLVASPSRTNQFIPRREAVAKFMLRSGGFIVGPQCKMLRKALLGGYRYQRVQVAGEERYKDHPEKNIYSHIADALQYLAMDADYTATSETADNTMPEETVDLTAYV